MEKIETLKEIELLESKNKYPRNKKKKVLKIKVRQLLLYIF